MTNGRTDEREKEKGKKGTDTNILTFARKAIRRRVFHCLLPVTCCLFLLAAGCGRVGGGAGDEFVLTVWETYNTEEHDVYVKLAQDFIPMAEKQFGVKVRLNIQRVPFDGLLQKLKTAAMTHTTPDIARVDIGDMATLAYGQALYAIDQMKGFPAKSIDEFREDFVYAPIASNIITIGRETHLYGLPDQTTCVALYWNREMFRDKSAQLLAAGLDPGRAPKTWDEFIRYGQVLTDSTVQKYGFAMDNGLWWTTPFFNTFGAPILEFDGRKWNFCLAGDSGIQALQLKKDLYNKYRIEAGAWLGGAIGPDQGFMNKKYAMIFSGPWRLETFKQSGVDYDVSLIPAGPAGTSTNVGGTNMAIFRKTKYPDISLAFLLYVSSTDFQVKWSKALQQIPVRISAIRIVAPDAPKHLQVFMQQMQTARPRLSVPSYFLLEQIVNAEMEMALKDIKPVPDALAKAKELIDAKVLNPLNEVAEKAAP